MYRFGYAGKKVETYWGSIQTIISHDEYVCKRMWMKAGSQSSMEYHVKKKETYFIEDGSLMVGLRVDRAKNTSVLLQKGDVFTIYPGQMHMRIAKEDVTILEVSTGETEGDTHFVEDGKTYTHIVEDK